MTTEKPHLTPAEELLIEVLIARHRMGEPFWTFGYNQRPTLKRLQAKGLVHVEPAVTEHLEGSLTELGRELYLSYDYTPSGATIEWGVQRPIDSRPKAYKMSEGPEVEAESELHCRALARDGGRLYRRWSITGDWVQQPIEVAR